MAVNINRHWKKRRARWGESRRYLSLEQLPEIFFENNEYTTWSIEMTTKNKGKLKTAAFWDIAPCSLVEADRLSEVRTASIIRVI
jgi:hypothetical protein